MNQAVAAPDGVAVDPLALLAALDEHFALVRATAVSAASKQCLIYSSSTYSIGAHPGMAGEQVNAEAWLQAGIRPEPQHSFRDMLSLQAQGCDFRLPFHERLIGAVSLPAVHGGATAASLTLAAITLAERAIDPASQWAPLSVTVHYLRAVQARPLDVRTVLRKPGARSCVVSATSFQSDAEKESAHANCLLVRSPRRLRWVRPTWPTAMAIRTRPVCSGRCRLRPVLTASPSARAPARRC